MPLQEMNAWMVDAVYQVCFEHGVLTHCGKAQVLLPPPVQSELFTWLVQDSDKG
jgi:hypothetical protein